MPMRRQRMFDRLLVIWEQVLNDPLQVMNSRYVPREVLPSTLSIAWRYQPLIRSLAIFSSGKGIYRKITPLG